MQLPFTASQFVGVFRAYNLAIAPLQLVAYALGIAAVALTLKTRRLGDKVITGILAGFWTFTGVGYHLLSFSRINPAARIFAVVFAVYAGLLLFAGLRGKLRFGYRGDTRSVIGLALATWAMFVYPALGFVFGHGFPNGPVFALTPCPLVIFTFGMLLLADRPPRYLRPAPVMWAIVGTTAAFKLGIHEDVSLGASALIYVALPVALRVRERLAGFRAHRFAGAA